MELKILYTFLCFSGVGFHVQFLLKELLVMQHWKSVLFSISSNHAPLEKASFEIHETRAWKSGHGCGND